MDVKKMLSEKTGLPVGEVAFVKPPPLPYIICLESDEIGGADRINCIRKVSMAIELYGCQIETEAEQKIEKALDEIGLPYEKNRVWITSEELFETIYNIEYVERHGGNLN